MPRLCCHRAVSTAGPPLPTAEAQEIKVLKICGKRSRTIDPQLLVSGNTVRRYRREQVAGPVSLSRSRQPLKLMSEEEWIWCLVEGAAPLRLPIRIYR
jgi:hypothetical protein